MLNVTPLRHDLAAAIRLRLRERWMPGDWFVLDDRVAGHYAAKAAVMAAVIDRLACDVTGLWRGASCRPWTVRMIEIGTRAGYSLQAFAEAADWNGCTIRALCLDAYLDSDSSETCRWFDGFNRMGRGLEQVDLVTVNTAAVRGIPWGDLAHVDGEHTDAGVYRDLELCRGCPVILADDCDNADVMAGVRRWLKDHPDRRCQFLDDGLRTLGVISYASGLAAPQDT